MSEEHGRARKCSVREMAFNSFLPRDELVRDVFPRRENLTEI